jgi:hypothetical protein
MGLLKGVGRPSLEARVVITGLNYEAMAKPDTGEFYFLIIVLLMSPDLQPEGVRA